MREEALPDPVWLYQCPAFGGILMLSSLSPEAMRNTSVSNLNEAVEFRMPTSCWGDVRLPTWQKTRQHEEVGEKGRQ